MAKKPQTIAKTTPKTATARRGRGGARLDLLLPRGWPASETGISWCWRSASGETRIGQGSLESLPTPGSAPVYVWTPATETLLTRTTLPTTSRAKLAQALPYALEEQLLDDPSDLHFAWRRDADGTLAVAVTAKERVRAWLAALQRAGIKPAALCPAMLAVPWSPDCWSAAYVNDELLVRAGPSDGFTCPAAADTPPALLATALRQQAAGARTAEYLIVFQPPSNFSADTWRNALGVSVRVESASMWETPGDSEPVINLMQGEFAPAGEVGKQLRPWIPAAAMAVLWLVGTVAFDAVDWWQLRRQHESNTGEMTSLLMSAFPETKTILDPYQQMQRGIEALQARGGSRPHDLLALLSNAARAWQAEPRIQLRSLQYTDRNLTLDVTVPDTTALEKLRQSLQTNGLQADVVSQTARSNEVESKLRIRAANAATPGAKS
jgi:general secretion pathway protein L